MTTSMGMTSFDLEDEVENEIEALLQYGEKKKDVYNEAVKMWVQVSPMLDDLFEREDREKRVLFVEEAVRRRVDEIQEQNNGHWTYDGPGNYRDGE